VELGVLRFVDHTHPPAAELFEDAVVGDGLPQERGGVRHLAHSCAILECNRPGRRTGSGATAVTVAVNFTTWPKTDGSTEAPRMAK
jgi:hypothetical protein